MTRVSVIRFMGIWWARDASFASQRLADMLNRRG